MKNLLRLIGLGLVTYLVFALAFLPAGVAFRWLAPPQLKMSGVSGTIWSGQASAIGLGGWSLGATQWSMIPSELLRARLAYHVRAEHPDGFVETDMSAGFGQSLEFGDLQGALPVASLSQIVPVAGLRGQVVLRFALLELKQGWPTAAEGAVALGNLEVINPITEILGDFRVDFAQPATADGVLVGQINDQGDGPLEVSGRLDLRPDRSYVLDGYVRPRGTISRDLQTALSLIGAQEPDGRRRFGAEGSL